MSYKCIINFIKSDSNLFRVEPTQLAFVILGASMAALALMILGTAILATGNQIRHIGHLTSPE